MIRVLVFVWLFVLVGTGCRGEGSDGVVDQGSDVDLGGSRDAAANADATLADLTVAVDQPAAADLPTGDLGGVDLAPVCPSYPAAGGGGLNRPMIALPAGSVTLLGVTATVDPFALDVFEVTVSAYRDCVTAGGCVAPQANGFTSPACNYTPTSSSYDTLPLNCVTHAQADDFCRWAGRRLPRRAEFVWAMRGSSSSTYPWGNIEPFEGTAEPNVCWQIDSGTCQVGSKIFTLFGAESCFGFADLAGNVREITSARADGTYAFPEPLCPLDDSVPCATMGGAYSSDQSSFFKSQSAIPFLAWSTAAGFRCAK